MKKVNRFQLMEVMADIMSDNDISFRQFGNHFHDSRVYNLESFDRTIELLKTDIKNKKIVDSKDLHQDLFKLKENGK